MKNTITFFILWMAIFGVCYLLGAFAQGTFDILQWPIDDRKFVSVAGGLVSLCIAAIATGMLSDSEGSTDDSIRD